MNVRDHVRAARLANHDAIRFRRAGQFISAAYARRFAGIKLREARNAKGAS